MTLGDPWRLRSMPRSVLRPALFAVLVMPIFAEIVPSQGAGVTGEEVEKAIREGQRYLKLQQRADGSWNDVGNEAHTGTTSLVVTALLAAGESPAEGPVARAL